MATPRIVGPRDGHMVFLGGADARFLVDGDETSLRPCRASAAAACAWRAHAPATTARTNTVSYLREQWVRSLATRSSSVIPVT